jgi:hypothetical protein
MSSHQRFSLHFAVSMAVLMLSGCGLKPQLVKHYSSTDAVDAAPVLKVAAQGAVLGDAQSLVAGNQYTVSAFVLPVPPKPSGSPAVLGFSDHGQASLIGELGERLPETSEFLDAIARSSLKSAAACEPAGPLRFERRLVLSLAGRHSRPATRFDGFAYHLALTGDVSDGIRFASWTRFESSQDNVSLGTTRLKQTQSLSATDVSSNTVVRAATGTIPAATLVDSLTAVLNGSRELEENVTSTRRYTPLTGVLSERSAAIVQQGAVGIDLFGNLTADFTIEVGKSKNVRTLSAKGLFDKTDAAQTDLTKITLSWCDRVVSADQNALKAKLTAAATLRRAMEGHETAIEGDDEASFLPLATGPGADIELVGEKDLSWMEYRIAQAPSEQGQPALYLTGSEPYVGTLSFGSLDQARAVVRWLRATGQTSLRGVPLGWPGKVAYLPSHAKALEVYLVLHQNGKEVPGPVWR